MEISNRDGGGGAYAYQEFSERGDVFAYFADEAGSRFNFLNIAEGSTGQTDPEQKKFLGYSLRSTLEVVNCIYLALRRNYINQQQFDKMYMDLEILTIKIQAFRNTL